MNPREPLKTSTGLAPHRSDDLDDCSNSSPRTFPAELQGKVIHCNHLSDAIIIRFAEHALTSHGESPYDQRTLQKIAEIVAKYGEVDAAERLKQIEL